MFENITACEICCFLIIGQFYFRRLDYINYFNMGSDGSKPQRSQQGTRQATQDEIDRIIARQRELYEQSRRSFLAQTNQTPSSVRVSTPNTSQGAYGPGPRNNHAQNITVPGPAPQNRNSVSSPNQETRIPGAQATPTQHQGFSNVHIPGPLQNRNNDLGNSFLNQSRVFPVAPSTPPEPQRLNISASPRPAPVQSSPVLESPPPNLISFERNRTPYSLNQNELLSRNTNINRNTLYPNLNNNSNQFTNDGGQSGEPRTNRYNPRNNNRSDSPDFIYVNDNGDESTTRPASSRGRSASGSRPNKTNGGNYNCPTCKNKFGLYIYQCSNGHSSCKNCKMNSSPCGLCNLQITDMRNITLEAYIAETKSSCPNASDGCRLYIKLADMELHVKECPFKELECPLTSLFGNCSWKGKSSHLSDHFTNCHSQYCQISVNSEAYLPNICFDDLIVHYVLIGTYSFLFFLKINQTEQKIYAGAQLVGTSVSASKWFYEIQVYNKREPRRKYQYTDTCHSLSVPIHEITGEGKCATMPLQYAMTFVNEGVLTYKFYIKKDYDGNNELSGQNKEPVQNYRGNNHRGRGARRRF